MAEKRFVKVGQLKKGNYVLIDDVPCKVTSISTSSPGKHGAAKAKIEARGVFDGKKRGDLKPTTAEIAAPVMEKKTAQVISMAGDMIQLMDMETYETFDLPMSAAEEAEGTVEAGKEVEILAYNGEMKITKVKG